MANDVEIHIGAKKLAAMQKLAEREAARDNGPVVEVQGL